MFCVGPVLLREQKPPLLLKCGMIFSGMIGVPCNVGYVLDGDRHQISCGVQFLCIVCSICIIRLGTMSS